MGAIVRDEAVQGDETQAAAAPSLPIAGKASNSQIKDLDDVAREVSEAASKTAPSPGKSALRRRSDIAQSLRFLARKLATIGIAVAAVLVAVMSWNLYNAAPWTRDASVRVQVANVAPQISGQIRELRVVDNQFVHKGDILYVIDPFDFEVALRSNKATLLQKVADHEVKKLQAERRRELTDLAESVEDRQIYEGAAIQAKAVADAGQEQVRQAEINLQRTEVRSPVNGFVTNLLLRVGNYAQQGTSNISVIDTDSYWIDGYFEETKLARLCVGDRAEAKLMGYSSPIVGHISTVTRGVSVSNAAVATQGLPNVDPVYTWVRLAQRVPVRIAIDKVPPGVPLVSGLTATVTIRNGNEGGTLFQKARTDLEDSFLALFGGDSARSGCIPNPS
ncbi:HlyD family secretion protein [Bradyrhizobium sp. Pear76]|uniref:biotin/lipoyl-binding protein n=1 Tax=Bradyrhizobium oropedii TaxID=1571201 RepID=UPI001E4AFCC5|nr:HlyD family secretion protein [Bradyrhizobium oropedii]MCC8961630.1 HlyD family secretion protein [Bradyrhizobium oropedii]